MKEKKLYPTLLIIVTCMLFFNLFVSLYEYFDYQKRVASGNARWEQVEERIEKIGRCCDGRNS